MELKGSRTAENLQTAFAGESMARGKYTLALSKKVMRAATLEVRLVTFVNPAAVRRPNLAQPVRISSKKVPVPGP